MSAEHNRRAVRRAMRAIEEGRPEALDGLVSEEVLDHASPDPAAGLAGVKQAAIAFHEAFPDVRIEVEDELAEGDRVVQRATIRGTHRGAFMGVAPTGREVAWGVTNWWRLQDGKIVERWSVADLLGVLTQLGVVPAPNEREASP